MKTLSIMMLLFFLLAACKAKSVSQGDREYDVDAVENSFTYIQGKKYLQSELEALTKLELMLMESEVYGRKGIVFGNFWQKKYIKLRTWFQIKPGVAENSISGIDKENLNLIRKIIKTKIALLPNILRPEGLKFKAVHTTLKLNEHKIFVSISGSISDSDWNILIHREYGQERKDPVLKAALERMKGTNGFYKVFIDTGNRVRAIDNYAGCCSFILSDKIKETYIFDESGKLIKLSKFYFGKSDSEIFYYYKNNQIAKVITVAYDVKTGNITDASVRDRVED